uniref:Major facilitator superfamily associated domain-containing protein n=1 Tax=Corvus moneduloides TaxID=1196302 RepID=A0A8U7P629_CORMO
MRASPGERWDVGRALALAALFRLLQGAGRGCAAPFVPLYLRLLGLPAPLVGAAAGARHLAALAVPLCCPRGRAGRRLLLAGSVLGSAGASLALTLIPPAGDTGCDRSGQLGLPGSLPSALPSTLLVPVPTTVPSPMTSPLPSPGTSSYTALSSSAVTDTRAVPKGTGRAAADVLAASRKPALGISTFQGLLGTPGALQENGRGLGEGNPKGDGSLDGPSGWTVRAVDQRTQEPERPAFSGPPSPGLQEETPGSAATDLADREYQVFLMVLGAVVLWELLATSLEWTMDESVYEYLDFVDATDRFGRLWLWSSVGAAAGACGVSVLVDQLDCSLGHSIPRLAVHFYSYAVLAMLSLLVSAFFPGHIPRKSARAPRLAKALALLWGDGQALLFAGTMFLVGAASSAGHNFVLWQLQDQGSSELLMGLWVALGPLAELGLHPLKGQLLRALPGARMVVLSLGVLAAQLLSYSLLRAPWAALPVQALSALSSGALRWQLEGTVGDIARPGTERALHALLGGLWAGGASLGSFGGGFVVQHLGLAVLFQASCVGLGLWILFFIIVQSRLPRQRKINYSRLLAADSSEMSDSEEENEKDWLVKAMKDESFNRNWIQQHGVN